MTIEELISIAERFYGNDKKACALRLIKSHAEITSKYIQSHPEIAASNITEIELLSIIMLEGFASHLIQAAAFDPRQLNTVSKILIESLESALCKISKTTETVLYRNDNDDFNKYNIGQKIKIKGFFTTSKDDFDNALSTKWIITPLSTEKTKAHEIYRIYNHGSDALIPEYQIEFERGATFVVTAIKNENRYRTIYITEIES